MPTPRTLLASLANPTAASPMPLLDTDWLGFEQYSPPTYPFIDSYPLAAPQPSSASVHPAMYINDLLGAPQASVPFAPILSDEEAFALLFSGVGPSQEAHLVARVHGGASEDVLPGVDDGGAPIDAFALFEAAQPFLVDAFHEGYNYTVALALAFPVSVSPQLFTSNAFKEGIAAAVLDMQSHPKGEDPMPTSLAVAKHATPADIPTEDPSTTPRTDDIMMAYSGDLLLHPGTKDRDEPPPAIGANDDISTRHTTPSCVDHTEGRPKVAGRRKAKKGRSTTKARSTRAPERISPPTPKLNGTRNTLAGSPKPTGAVIAMIVLIGADSHLPINHLQLLVEVLDNIAGWGWIAYTERKNKNGGWRMSLQRSIAKCPALRIIPKCIPSPEHEPLKCLGQCNRDADVLDPKGQGWMLDLAVAATETKSRKAYAEARQYRVPFSIPAYLDELRERGLLPVTDRFVSQKSLRS